VAPRREARAGALPERGAPREPGPSLGAARPQNPRAGRSGPTHVRASPQDATLCLRPPGPGHRADRPGPSRATGAEPRAAPRPRPPSRARGAFRRPATRMRARMKTDTSTGASPMPRRPASRRPPCTPRSAARHRASGTLVKPSGSGQTLGPAAPARDATGPRRTAAPRTDRTPACARRRFGTATWTDGSRHEGMWANGREHGRVRRRSRAANPRGSAAVRRRARAPPARHGAESARFRGQGKYTTDGMSYVGSFVDGLIDGEGRARALAARAPVLPPRPLACARRWRCARRSQRNNAACPD
jgi:hypothetical protein